MTKIVIAGETFDYDGKHQPMSEALKIEELYGKNYAAWQFDLASGSARAYCMLAWLVWKRDGRDVALADIIDGKVDFDVGEMMQSVYKAGEAAEAEAKAAEADPTDGSDPAGTPGTGTGT